MSPQAVDCGGGTSEVPEGAGAADDEAKNRACKSKVAQVNTGLWKEGEKRNIVKSEQRKARVQQAFHKRKKQMMKDKKKVP